MPNSDDPYSGYNAMQAHMGVMPMTPVMPPGAAAQMLVSQADQQRSYAVAAGLPSHWQSGAGAMGAASMFGDQFRQRFEHIQSQQSFNPYVAHQMAQGGTPNYLPSPLMMTPPSTGVFSARPEGPRFMPLPPQPMMPMFQTPFTPQLPPPMFQSAADRMYRMQDMSQDRFFAHAIQAPRLFGAGLGMGASAFIGGAAGGPIGAGVGGALGYTSGFAGGVGNLMMRPFQPMMERHQMGAAIRDFSQEWVTTGHDRHRAGMGFSREASLRLAESIQELSKDRAFKRDTGGMFNQSDLVSITRESGRAGLLDESQDIEGVRKNIKNVSRTLKKYMQLTQDPDMVNVLRELGQMKQFGMTLEDMELAAGSMSRYSKAAGMSIAGIKQMGLYGGTTFQQAGLTAGSGMTYGMHAAAAARQAVATGTFEPRELALLGGVQGLTQRNIQAQAAMFSMPLFGASVAGYGPGGFNLNQGNLQGLMGGGAVGMVNQAVGNMNAAVGQGGIGALATFPLQQRRIQTMAAERLSSEQATAMRFQMAYQTGQQLGLSGSGAFAAGARMHYGDEVAEQMMYEAQNPQYFQEQRNSINERRQAMIREQRAQAAEAAPTSMGISGGALYRGSGLGILAEGYAGIGSAVSTGWSRAVGGFRSIGQSFQDVQAESEGRYVRRMRESATYTSAAQRQNVAAMGADVLSRGGAQIDYSLAGGPRYSSKLVAEAYDQSGRPISELSEVLGVGAKITSPGLALLSGALGIDAAAGAGLETLMGKGTRSSEGEAAAAAMVRQQAVRAHSFVEAAKWGGTVGRTEKGQDAVIDALNTATKNKVGAGAAVGRAASLLTQIVKSRQLPFIDAKIRPEEVTGVLRNALRNEGMSAKEVEQAISQMRSSGELEKVTGMVIDQARSMYPGGAKVFDEAVEDAQKMYLKTADEGQAPIMARRELMLKALENQLDLTRNIGMAAFSDKGGAAEYKELVKTTPTAKLLAQTVAAVRAEAGGLAPKARAAALAEYTKLYGQGKDPAAVAKEFDKLVMSAAGEVGKMSSDVRERMVKSVTSSEAGGIDKGMANVAMYSVEAAKAAQYGGVVGGGLQSIAETVGGETGASLYALMGEGKEVTGSGIASRLGEKGIAALVRKNQKGLAAKLARLRKGDLSAEDRAKLDQEVMQDISSMGEARELQEIELGVAKGREAEKLDEADQSLAGIQSEMAAAFKDFGPAAKTFAEGADRLNQAMNSDLYKKMVEG